MLARCPLCRARLAGADTCPRCGADLALPRAARGEAARYFEQALACLAAGDRQGGAEYTNQALRLHRTRLAEVVADWLTAPENRGLHGTDPGVPSQRADNQQPRPHRVEEYPTGVEQAPQQKPEDAAPAWTRIIATWKVKILKRLRGEK